MGQLKQWDVADVARQINTASFECSSPYNDGFYAWGVKQDLYILKWHIEDALSRCPTFDGEEEWVRTQEKEKVIRILKGDI